MAEYYNFKDEELLVLIKNQDQAAFAQLYERYWSELYLQAFKVLRDEAAAKDVVQEVFIGLWNKGAGWEIKNNLKVYFFMAVRNRALNLIRDQKVRKDYVGLFSLYMDAHRNTTLEQVQEKEMIAAIDRVVASLPDRMREIFQLSRKSYLSHREIAERLGITEATVSRQISNALLILKRELNISEGLAIAMLFSEFFLKK